MTSGSWRRARAIVMSLGLALAQACTGVHVGDDGPDDWSGRTQAFIGPEGGVLEVADPGNGLYGVKVTVPPGAVTERTAFFVEYGGAPPAALPTGLSADYPLAQFGPTGTFAAPLEITFPVTYIPTGEGHILGAYCWNPTRARWVVNPARRVDDGAKLIVSANQLALCRWGTVRLGEVDDDTVRAWMDDLQGMVDDWANLKAQLLAELQPLVEVVEDPYDLARCSTQNAILSTLASWRAGALAGMTTHLATLARVCTICDRGGTSCIAPVCDADALISGQPLLWLQKEAQIWMRSMFISSACPVDALGPIVEKLVAWGMYQEAIRELRCDWRCVVKHGDGEFWGDLLLGNVCTFSIFGIELWRSHEGCI